MQFAKSSVLAVLVVVFAVAHAAPAENGTDVADPVPSGLPAEEKEETTLPPTRLPDVPAQTPALIHGSTAAPQVAETTKTEATVQSAPEKPASNAPKTENQKGAASSLHQVCPLVFSTVAVVLFSAYSLV